MIVTHISEPLWVNDVWQVDGWYITRNKVGRKGVWHYLATAPGWEVASANWNVIVEAIYLKQVKELDLNFE
jgi:hypothetical protein